MAKFKPFENPAIQQGLATALSQVVASLVGALVDSIVHHHSDAEEHPLPAVLPPVTQMPTPPGGIPPHVLPFPSNPGTATKGKLQSWFEAFWHDWFRGYPDQVNPPGSDGAGSDWAGNGQPIWEDIVNQTKGAPPGVVVRFMTGILPQPSTVPSARKGIPVPFPIVHKIQFDDQLYELPSTSDGSSQPVPGLGHVQFGPLFQDSGGWDVIIRTEPKPGVDLHMLTYSATAPGGEVADSDPVSIRVARP